MGKQPKTYLNKDERDKIVFMGWMNGFMTDILSEWALTKEEHRWLKTADTYTYKFLQALFKRVGQDQAEKVIKTIKATTIKLHEKETGKKGKEPAITFKVDSKDNMDEIAEGVIASWCSKCMKEDYKKCPIREMFEQAEVEKFDPYAKDKCQFKINI